MQGDWENEEGLITKLLHLGAQRIAQEVMDYLGRDHYEHHGVDQEYHGYQNGYRWAAMDTAEGRVPPWSRSSTAGSSGAGKSCALSLEAD